MIVFVVTSSGNDIYSAMTRIAVASIRLSNRSLTVSVACDRQTDNVLREVQDPLLKEVDHWLPIDTPEGNAGFRNRYIKTGLRLSLGGPFLFLDSDVLVRGDLRKIFDTLTDIAAAPNHSRDLCNEQIWEGDQATLSKMRWHTGSEVYINGGVLFWNDTPGARALAAEWRTRWLESESTCGNFRDQPALNSALHHTKATLTVLSHRYNAQFQTTPARSKDAALWHYYSSNDVVQNTPFELYVNSILDGRALDYKQIQRMLSNIHPWCRDSIIDDWAAMRVIRRNRFNSWEAAWLERRFWRALFTHFRRIPDRLRRSRQR